MPVPHDIPAETELWDTYAESAFKDDAEPSFCWTQYAAHGPGPELLGDPHSVLEIGCGTRPCPRVSRAARDQRAGRGPLAGHGQEGERAVG